MKRALAPRDNGETLDEKLEGKVPRRCVGNYIDENGVRQPVFEDTDGLLNRLAEGPEMPPETSAAEQEAVRAEWRTAVERIRDAEKIEFEAISKILSWVPRALPERGARHARYH